MSELIYPGIRSHEGCPQQDLFPKYIFIYIYKYIYIYIYKYIYIYILYIYIYIYICIYNQEIETHVTNPSR